MTKSLLRYNPSRVRRLMLALPRLARLGWRLASDERVPLRHRAVLGAAVGYAVSPVDLAPDPLPLIGRLDDVLVVAAGVAWAMHFAPPEIVDEHLAELGTSRERIEEAITDVLPPPAYVAYRNRHRIRAGFARGAAHGIDALLEATERLADRLEGEAAAT
jgi:uncharacterized membrane protein YkvA (DUF1232 family)